MAKKSRFVVFLIGLVLVLNVFAIIPLNGTSSSENSYSRDVVVLLEQFRSNTRVQQWQHYYDTVNPQNFDQSARNKYYDNFRTILINYGFPLAKAEVYSEIPGIESGWKTKAVSKAGAIGIWQILPSTAKQFHFRTRDLYDPIKSAHCAAQYLLFLDSLFDGDVSSVLFAYNGGQGTVNTTLSRYKTSDVWLAEFSSRETHNFAPKVLGAWLYYKYTTDGRIKSISK